MTEEKKTRIMAAFAVNAILLFAILLCVLGYQFIEIGILNKHRKEYSAEIRDIAQLMEDDKDLIKQLQSEEYYEYYCIWHPEIVKAYLESRNQGNK